MDQIPKIFQNRGNKVKRGASRTPTTVKNTC